MAESIINNLDSNSELIITGEYRSGDIRHNYANLEKSAKDLSFISKTDFNDGLKKFLEWALLQPDTNLNFESSLQELSDIGLLKKSTGS